MSTSYLDFDVDVDWLYKGSKKNKNKPQTALAVSQKDGTASKSTVITDGTDLPSVNSTRNNSRKNSNDSLPSNTQLKSSKSHEILNTEGINLNKLSRTLSNSSANARGTFSANTTKRNRSKSFSLGVAKREQQKQYAPVSAATSLISNVKLKKTASTNAKQTTQPVTKKSFFSSLFGKSSSSNNSIPPPNNSVPLSSNNSLESLPSMNKIRSRSRSSSNVSASSIPINLNANAPVINNISDILEDSFHETNSENSENSIKRADKELKKINLKRIRFAVDKFGMDPPQQIPCRKPKVGDVLIPSDLLTPTPSINVGITGTKNNGATANVALTKDSKEYKRMMDDYNKLLKEADRHQEEAHFAAQRIADEVSNYTISATVDEGSANTKRRDNSATTAVPEAQFNHSNLENIEIDKPIHLHHSFNNDEGQDAHELEVLTLDQIYTRCCHLREILPIATTLKQLKKKQAPLHVLKFLNPRPTLIDILSFCDFISIVPIHNIVFDNVSLTPEMFQILLSSLANSTHLEKLSIRNVVIDPDMGWKQLCKFLLVNKSLVKLDISQTKIRTDLDPKFYRANMDWDLFCGCVLARSLSFDELLINGVNFNARLKKDGLTVFNNILNCFGATSPGNNQNKSKKKIGLAQTNLSIQQLDILIPWASQCSISGVDISYNTLNNSMVKTISSNLLSHSFEGLNYITLNSTGLSSGKAAALLLKTFSKLPKIYFLDLSNNSQIFPEVLPYLDKYLPRFPCLKRLHLDNNDFDFKTLSFVCNVLVKCDNLLHISIVDQPLPSLINFIGGIAVIYDMVKSSKKLINLDINYDALPDEISSRIALFLLKNTRKSMDTNSTATSISDDNANPLDNQDELLFNGQLITETAESIFESINQNNANAVGNGVSTNKDSSKTDAGSKVGRSATTDDSTKKYLLRKYYDKICQELDSVQKTIDALFEKRMTQELPMKEKENLLRLIFLERTLHKIIDILTTSPEFSGLKLPPVDSHTSYSFASDSPNNNNNTYGNINSNANNTFNGADHTSTNVSDERSGSTLSSNSDFDNVGNYGNSFGLPKRGATTDVNSNDESLTVSTDSNDTNANGSKNVTTRPHLITTESGRTVDIYTGRPVLVRHSSDSSSINKKLEQEEGEFHKWGVFVQQQNSIYPEYVTSSTLRARSESPSSRFPPGITPPSVDRNNRQSRNADRSTTAVDVGKTKQPSLKLNTSNTSKSNSGATSASSTTSTTSSFGVLSPATPASGNRIIDKIPSGNELREALIKAKGINSIQDLITKVNSNRVNLDSIYGVHYDLSNKNMNPDAGKVEQSSKASVNVISSNDKNIKTNSPSVPSTNPKLSSSSSSLSPVAKSGSSRTDISSSDSNVSVMSNSMVSGAAATDNPFKGMGHTNIDPNINNKTIAADDKNNSNSIPVRDLSDKEVAAAYNKLLNNLSIERVSK
ncbi:uncharacterized protein SCODWIG_02832 [Saccharomycodes ludwigii]|uniref:GLC7-interacting protein 3 n=1 Tax=Saccharomycodes ludwigii TaxID=36035 RepID=A0A376B8Y0_9ASCO|nr:hypothetical protein SCDLUD_002084 [Saccharomycodes ludwigii]KAH3902267.1 hypothetical protein SCDLUD_002084 [Saccharomycodes ludwigii]SSD61071.1 uncharacterized protein SCODWIG_02832 [Saccharomycodes ludwigii]